jgi:hypothetical protein
MDQIEVLKVNAWFKAQVGYWATRNGLQDYKIYGTIIQMFILEYLNSL